MTTDCLGIDWGLLGMKASVKLGCFDWCGRRLNLSRYWSKLLVVHNEIISEPCFTAITGMTGDRHDELSFFWQLFQYGDIFLHSRFVLFWFWTRNYAYYSSVCYVYVVKQLIVLLTLKILETFVPIHFKFTKKVREVREMVGHCINWQIAWQL